MVFPGCRGDCRGVVTSRDGGCLVARSMAGWTLQTYAYPNMYEYDINERTDMNMLHVKPNELPD